MPMTDDRPPFRADHVGSLLRPDALLAKRAELKAGRITPAELRREEDRHIQDAVRAQEAAGLKAVTDGEYRRESFHFDFISRLGGVNCQFDLDRAIAQAEGTKQTVRAPFTVTIEGRLSRPEAGIEVENFRYLKSLTSRMGKITIPSPTMTHFRGGRAAISATAYPDMEGYFADLARVYREEIAGLAAAGCRYVQMDDTNLAYLCDEKMREGVRRLGEDPKTLPETYAALINDSIRDRPKDFAVCVHLCRGNARSQWFAQGGYEPVAEAIFNKMEVDGFFLEYDDERSGDFAPLRFVPKGKKKIVLGLITSKSGKLEDRGLILRRIEAATKYVPLEQLCLSPQCGFSSNAIGNLVTPEEQWAKLRYIVDIAKEVWG